MSSVLSPQCNGRQGAVKVKKAGFSLVELSIVLVILGLLTGGILTGQSLIRAAELRSVTTEFQKYQTAVMTFKQKYYALPGDMVNATDFWGSATCPGTAGMGSQTCNGNGNGVIENAAASATQYAEKFMFWQHLSNAGLIEGSYTGINGSSSSNRDGILAVNVPASKLSNAGWDIDGSLGNNYVGTAYYFAGDYGNYIWVFGKDNGQYSMDGMVITPEEAWNIDKKFDDGKPAQGRLWSKYPTTCANGADENDRDADYNLAQNTISCALIFRMNP